MAIRLDHRQLLLPLRSTLSLSTRRLNGLQRNVDPLFFTDCLLNLMKLIKVLFFRILRLIATPSGDVLLCYSFVWKYGAHVSATWDLRECQKSLNWNFKTLFSSPDLGFIRSISVVKKIIKIEVKERKTLINTPRLDTNRYSNCTPFSKNLVSEYSFLVEVIWLIMVYSCLSWLVRNPENYSFQFSMNASKPEFNAWPFTLYSALRC